MYYIPKQDINEEVKNRYSPPIPSRRSLEECEREAREWEQEAEFFDFYV